MKRTCEWQNASVQTNIIKGIVEDNSFSIHKDF